MNGNGDWSRFSPFLLWVDFRSLDLPSCFVWMDVRTFEYTNRILLNILNKINIFIYEIIPEGNMVEKGKERGWSDWKGLCPLSYRASEDTDILDISYIRLSQIN